MAALSDEEKKADSNSKDDKNAKDAKKSKRAALIRHGEALHNKDSQYWYQVNNPLTKEGVKQLTEFREQLVKDDNFYNKIEGVVTSPLLRAMQTTEILFPKDIIDKYNIKIYVSHLQTELRLYGLECNMGNKKSYYFDQKWFIDKGYSKWIGWDDIPDVWYPTDTENTNEARIEQFKKYCINTIKHDTFAIVGHKHFLHAISGKYLKNGEVHWIDIDKQWKNVA